MIRRACLAMLVVAALAMTWWLGPARERQTLRKTVIDKQPGDGDCQSVGSLPPTARSGYFPDVTDKLGIDFTHVVGPLGTYFMPEVNGAGGALFDYDGDGDLDLFFVGSGRSPAAQGEFPPGTRPGNRLYRQDDGTFTDVTAGSGLEGEGFGVGCAVGDIDNDGDLDLFVTDLGRDRLYRNNGNGTFTEIGSAAGIDENDYGTCAAFLDYDRDGWLDLVVVNYVHDPEHGLSVACASGTGRNSYCGPHKFLKSIDRVYHNEGVTTADGTAGPVVRLRDVTTSVGLSDTPTAGFGIVCADFNRDGWPDFYIANDMAPKPMWINQQGSSFRDEATVRGVAVSGRGLAQGSMGVAIGDVDGDSAMDLVVTNLYNEATVYYRNDGAGLFADRTQEAQLRGPTLRHTGWGVALVDFDHDGDLDLAQVNGLVVPCGGGFPPHGEDKMAVVHETIANPAVFWRDYGDTNLLLFNDGSGRFADERDRAGEFVRSIASGRALIWGDIDNDGDIDLVVTNCGGRARIYRNEVPRAGHWLMVRALDPHLKRDAIGTELTVVAGGKSFRRLVDPASSYLAANDLRAHFGLGTAALFDEIVVLWPDGTREHFSGGPADRLLILNRGKGRPAAVETEQ